MKFPGEQSVHRVGVLRVVGGEGRLGELIPGWWRGPFPMLSITLWFGLVTGLLELTFLVTRVQVFEDGAWMRSPHLVWMVPVSDLLIAAVGGLFLGLFARAWPRWGRRLAVGTFVMLACLSQLLLIRGLNSLTCVLIAGGLAGSRRPSCSHAGRSSSRWSGAASRRSLPSSSPSSDCRSAPIPPPGVGRSRAGHRCRVGHRTSFSSCWIPCVPIA